MLSKTDEQKISKKYELIVYSLNELSKRIWAAAESLSYGRGGIAIVCRATGMSNNTIYRGLSDLKETEKKHNEGIRAKGGGRKKIIATEKRLLEDLDKLIDPATRGDPESPLRWTSKSIRKLTEELKNMGYRISYWTVSELLKNELNYSLQANRKTYEGSNQPDRDQQFEYIYQKANHFLEKDQPVISVDTKKKEFVGNFKNEGEEWEKIKNPIKVEAYNFPSISKGKVAPYGVYDLAQLYH